MPDEFEKMLYTDPQSVDLQTIESLNVIPIPDAHYAAIGKVNDAWSDIEFEIDRLLWKLIEQGEEKRQAVIACVTAQMVSIFPRTHALRSLLRFWKIKDEIVKDTNKWISEISDMAEKRNRTIHDKRMVIAKTHEVVRFEVSARGNRRFEPVVETIASLMEFRDSIQNMHRRLNSISEAIDYELKVTLKQFSGPYPYIRRGMVKTPILPTDI